MVKQRVYIQGFSRVLRKSYFVLRHLIHCVLELYLCEVSPIRQIVMGGIFEVYTTASQVTTNNLHERKTRYDSTVKFS